MKGLLITNLLSPLPLQVDPIKACGILLVQLAELKLCIGFRFGVRAEGPNSWAQLFTSHAEEELLELTHRPQSSSFWGSIFRIL